jgi:hypothetical protein
MHQGEAQPGGESLGVTSGPDESEDNGRRSWYPGPSDPGRRAFYVAMLWTALVTIGLIAFSVYARIRWPNCWYRCW